MTLFKKRFKCIRGGTRGGCELPKVGLTHRGSREGEGEREEGVESRARQRAAAAALRSGKSFALGLAAAQSVSWMRMSVALVLQEYDIPQCLSIAIVFVYSYICARPAN